VVVFDSHLVLPYCYDPEAAHFSVRSPWLEDPATSPVVLPKTIWSRAVNRRVSRLTAGAETAMRSSV
jgi:hypothetical protein